MYPNTVYNVYILVSDLDIRRIFRFIEIDFRQKNVFLARDANF